MTGSPGRRKLKLKPRHLTTVGLPPARDPISPSPFENPPNPRNRFRSSTLLFTSSRAKIASTRLLGLNTLLKQMTKTYFKDMVVCGAAPFANSS